MTVKLWVVAGARREVCFPGLRSPVVRVVSGYIRPVNILSTVAVFTVTGTLVDS